MKIAYDIMQGKLIGINERAFILHKKRKNSSSLLYAHHELDKRNLVKYSIIEARTNS
jgi:hypothetical protein